MIHNLPKSLIDTARDILEAVQTDEQTPSKLHHVAEIKTNFPDADYYVTRKGSMDAVGKITNEFSPEHIGVKITRTDLLHPKYHQYAMQYAHMNGYWKGKTKGSLSLQHISVNDVKNMPFIYKGINESFYSGVELPQTSDVKEMNQFVKDNSDIYNQKSVKLYHGTHPTHDILNQGLLPTSSKRRLSLQSGSGHVYLSTTPEMAKQFGDIGNGINNSKVYEVSVPVHKLLPDKDQLKNKRMYETPEIGNSIGDSIVHGKTVRVKGKIDPWQIREYSHD